MILASVISYGLGWPLELAWYTYGMIFITGAATAGKTSVIKHLQEQLPSDKYDIHDIDEADKWGDDYEVWRDAKIEHWLKQSIKNRKQGIETILCGIIYPEHVIKSPSYAEAEPVEYIDLYATPEVITARYLETRKAWMDRQIEISDELRNELKGIKNAQIIDTSTISPNAVAKKVLRLVQPSK